MSGKGEEWGALPLSWGGFDIGNRTRGCFVVDEAAARRLKATTFVDS